METAPQEQLTDTSPDLKPSVVSAFRREETSREPLGVKGGARELTLTGRVSLKPNRTGALFHLILSVV